MQSRGQFSNFGSSDRSNQFQFDSNPYNFAPVAQKQQPQRVNPFSESAAGYGEVSSDNLSIILKLAIAWCDGKTDLCHLSHEKWRRSDKYSSGFSPESINEFIDCFKQL